ncbi:ADP-ribosylglycohydrolase family protein [Undibacterium sp. Ji50W]|uniref:ADP-ribosylglycohydrolase family protein n=1 Tax=Undibacterium sp. Ji50W TaxID=3413041 RepID=UPI003BF2796C
MVNIAENQIIRSALWAAYGDVVGFPTELLTEQEFLKRNNIELVQGPIEWTRRVGGLFGPKITFAIGTYSDDTQLRLSTSRAIRGDGYFDVESFAKIELPVWLNYALGAGRGSKAAAANLAFRESTWSQNFFKSGDIHYCNGGGNGAAMRIQPHVWQAHAEGPNSFMNAVIKNSICTHGHPRAIIGAAVHAFFLYNALVTKKSTPPEDWASIGDTAAISAYETLTSDPELALVWVPNWEHLSGKELKTEWSNTILEWHESVDLARKYCANFKDPVSAYRSIVTALGGLKPSERGSGLKTALFAIVLAWLFRNDQPEVALLVSANTFNSDTDTIATMAGALIGSVSETAPNCEIQDAEYIRKEARRLYLIGSGKKQSSFKYPDLLTWVPPKNQSDAWIEIDEKPNLSGLGEIVPFNSSFSSEKGNELMWQWCLLPFGQTVLAKRRRNQINTPYPRKIGAAIESSASQAKKTPHIIERALTPNSTELNIDVCTQLCIQSGFDAKIIGETLLSLATEPNGIERCIAFSAIIAKAKIARSKR